MIRPFVSALLLATMGATALALGGCTGPKCNHDDLDCFLENMVVIDPKGDGATVDLVAVDRGKLEKKSPGKVGPTPACGDGTSFCNGTCANLSTDPSNCGACGVVCPSSSCQGGTCAPAVAGCPAGTTSCNNTCVNTGSDPYNCGSCGYTCNGLLCSQGQCVSSCGGGLAQCGAGCTDVQSDPFNCGGCGTTCAVDQGQPCVGGSCGGCAPGDGWCPGTGCTYTGGDENNCGGCGIRCSPGQICDGGLCQCPDNLMTCDPSGEPQSSGGAPSIDNTPAPVDYADPETLQPLELDFTDPNGCQPSFCFHVCIGADCSSSFMCTPLVADHQTSGAWSSYIGFLAEASDTQATFTTGIVAVSSAGCDETLTDQLADGADVEIDVSLEVSMEVTVELPPDDTYSESSGSYGSGGPTAQCSDSVPTCNCSVSACASSDGTCWYETSNGRFDCSGCDCNAAAQAIVNACCPQ